jgi:hypothetical protein
VQDGLNTAWSVAAAYANAEPDAYGMLELNRDFGITQREATEIDVLLRARVAGEISRDTFINELARRKVIPENTDVEVEKEKIARDAMLDPGDEFDNSNDTLPGNDTTPAA